MKQQQPTSYRLLQTISVAIYRNLMTMIPAVFLLAGCTSWLPEAHKLDIVQGNAITPQQVAQLHTGMPKADVRALLGAPVLRDPFHEQRWDYIFRYLEGGTRAKQSRLTLHFEEDILRRIDDSDYIDPDTILPPPRVED